MNSPEAIFPHSEQPSFNLFNNSASLHAEVASRAKLGEVMRKIKAIDDSSLERIVSHQQNTGQLFGQAAVELKLVDESTLARALAEQESLAVGTSMLFEMRRLSDRGGARSVALVSPDHGEGRSWIAGNLAVVFAQLGMRTLLIDADLRRPRQHMLFNQSGHDGLVPWLSGRTSSPMIRTVEAVPHLHLLAAGSRPPNPQELLSGDPFRTVLDAVAQSAAIAIVDTPPAEHYADFTFAVLATEAVVVVVKRGSPQRRTRALVERLRALGRPPIGIVFNQR
ncbi:MAG: hypothetical protein NTV17_17105 [Burkholderiales bacterium]|nr:hypothetical protein [Burkholderiales bacterium]